MKIEKSELRKKGSTSKARRTMEKYEFEKILQIANNRQGYSKVFIEPITMKF